MKSTESLERINSKVILKKSLQNPRLLIRHYFIYRDPYKRLYSLFFDKFRKFPKENITSEKIKSRYHRVVLDYLKVELENNQEIKQVLLNITFQEFILKVLPNTYMLDGHTRPQVTMIRIDFKRRFMISIPTLKRGYNLDNPIQMQKLSNRTGINFSKKVNSTEKYFEDYTWSREMKAVVNHLYQEDFKRFGIRPII